MNRELPSLWDAFTNKGQSLARLASTSHMGLPTITHMRYDARNIELFQEIVNKRPAPSLRLADTFTDSNHITVGQQDYAELAGVQWKSRVCIQTHTPTNL